MAQIFYSKKTDLLTRVVAGETLIVPICNNVGDLDSIFTLNATGARIWEMLDETPTLDELAPRFAAEYSLATATARADIEALLDELVDANLLNREAAAR